MKMATASSSEHRLPHKYILMYTYTQARVYTSTHADTHAPNMCAYYTYIHDTTMCVCILTYMKYVHSVRAHTQHMCVCNLESSMSNMHAGSQIQTEETSTYTRYFAIKYTHAL